MEKIKVLYVDDELVNLNAFKASFRRIFDVHIAKSADEGRAILDNHQIEVIISDQRMPGKTGTDFFESILEKHPKPIRILLTAYTDINAIIDAINKGQVYRYVTKPWSEFELKLTIENAYNLYHLRDQNNKLHLKYRTIFNTSTDPIILFDTNGRIIDYNYATKKLFNFKHNELHLASFVSHLDNKKHATEIISTLEKYESLSDFECEVIDGNGELKRCLASIDIIKDKDNNILNYQVILKDITARHNMNKLLLKTIIDTQEQERERISKDLHDGLGQTLAALKLNVDAVKTKQEFNEKECNHIENLIATSTAQLREICFDTLPNVLSKFGLVKAVEELVNRSQSSLLTINFNHHNKPITLDKTMAIAIYRIIQEFINNTIKHSEASVINIDLDNLNENLSLNLYDNGKGFVVKDLMIYKGQGLKNIESRVKSLNGDVIFKSEINKGTEFNISFPINLN